MELGNISFAGKTGIITGGAQGIGRAIAKGFVQMGGKAVIVDINPETAARTCEELGNAVYYTVDLGDSGRGGPGVPADRGGAGPGGGPHQQCGDREHVGL